MNTSQVIASEEQVDIDIDEAGPGMLASRSFWIGGALSAGLWTLLLLAV
jgi:hypothetical protein